MALYWHPRAEEITCKDKTKRPERLDYEQTKNQSAFEDCIEIQLPTTQVIYYKLTPKNTDKYIYYKKMRNKTSIFFFKLWKY